MRVLVLSLITHSCLGANVSAVRGPRAFAFEARYRQYVSHGPGYSLSVTSGEALLDLRGHTIRMSLDGANPKWKLDALDLNPGKANYILGSDVRASYELFGRVRWRGVYSGIDLLFKANEEQLEYTISTSARAATRGESDLASKALTGFESIAMAIWFCAPVRPRFFSLSRWLISLLAAKNG